MLVAVSVVKVGRGAGAPALSSGPGLPACSAQLLAVAAGPKAGLAGSWTSVERQGILRRPLT